MTPTEPTGEGLTITFGGKVIQTIPLTSPRPGQTIVRYHLVEIIQDSTVADERYAVETKRDTGWATLSAHAKLSDAALAFESAQGTASIPVRLFDRKKSVVLDGTDDDAPALAAPGCSAWGINPGTPDERILQDMPPEEEVLLNALVLGQFADRYEKREVRDESGRVLHSLN